MYIIKHIKLKMKPIIMRYTYQINKQICDTVIYVYWHITHLGTQAEPGATAECQGAGTDLDSKEKTRCSSRRVMAVATFQGQI